MVTMSPPEVYIHESVYDNRPAEVRLQRMMKTVKTRQVQVVDDEALGQVVEEHGWLEMTPKRTGQIDRKADPILVFNTFRFLPDEEFRLRRGKTPALSAYHLLGTGPYTFRNASAFGNGVCKSAYEIHSAWGCYHACDYCHVKDFINIMLNLEDFVEHLDPLVKRETQRLYKYDNQTDTLCFEPEYGASELLVDYFAQQQDRFLMLYTKSDNVEHLLGLNHGGHTIVNWTLSCETVAREIERKAPSMEQRLKAAESCQKAGYAVRFRCSPIVPIRDWRDENREMIRRMFSRVQPDLITMDVLGWMSARQLAASMDLSLFEDRYRSLIQRMADSDIQRLEHSPKQIIPHPMRLEIYRFFLEEIRSLSKDTPVALCMETHEMWAELTEELGMSKSDYVCCCGPLSVPGHAMLPWKTAPCSASPRC